MTALYIHLPFCKRKCNYCDFVSYAGKEGLIDSYVEAVCREITALTRWHKTLPPLPEGEGKSTLFFGGGTPTLLEPKHFDDLINTIICHLSLDIGHSELSVEANPGTADLAKLQQLRQLGFNRLSIGVQSFNDQHLRTLGRIHGSATAKRFYQDAREAGFDNINLDLIFALPGQTLAEWKADLAQALELNIDHLSVYNLQIEEATPFALKYKKAEEDLELAMYEVAIDTLTAAGYKHYEISNFARPGRECQHNLVYWRNGNYLGVGAGAHSHWNGERRSNPNCIEAYMRWALGEAGNVLRDAKRVTHADSRFSTAQRETLFLGLRLLDGLEKGKFGGFEKEVGELIDDGLLTEENGNYKLTRRGLYLGNEVFARFV